MSLLIKKPGVLTTVQDIGRIGWRRFGINPNGPMDPAAARIANILAGNDEHAALLEMHFPAPELTFEEPKVFALCGADLGAEVNGVPIAPWRAARVEADSTLRFTSKSGGERAYLGVRGGIDVPLWLSSSCTNLAAHIGGHEGRALKAGDRLTLGSAGPIRSRRLPAAAQSIVPRYGRFPTVRVIRGAEFYLLSASDKQTFLETSFTISGRSDRMGYRLDGQPLSCARPADMLSAAVCFGTIQLPSNGQMIVLMADQQTAGGYPRIAHVVSTDLPLLAQLGPGDKVAFHMIEIEEAERLMLEFERDLSLLRTACRLAYE